MKSFRARHKKALVWIYMCWKILYRFGALQTRFKQHHIWSKNTELPNGPPPVCLTSILHVCLSECLLYVQCMHHPDIITYSALTLLVWKWLPGWSSGVDGGWGGRILEINRDGSDRIQLSGNRSKDQLSHLNYMYYLMCNLHLEGELHRRAWLFQTSGKSACDWQLRLGKNSNKGSTPCPISSNKMPKGIAFFVRLLPEQSVIHTIWTSVS